MFQSLDNIKRLRKSIDINQAELAKKAGVSQSLIAKIEAGKVEPTYNNAKKIFEALDELKSKEELKAKDLMNTKLVFANVDDSLFQIIKLMKQKNVSQLPVLNKDKVCGMVTENAILEKVLENPNKIKELKAEDIMQEAPPIIPKESGLRLIQELIKQNPIILVAEKGEVKGIISKTDLLDRI